MKVETLIASLVTFPQHLPVVIEGRVNQDGTAGIADIQVAINNGREEVHLISEVQNATPFEERSQG